ncbi:MAG: hypothetical protein HFI75_02585 [Lachnospiraceae bacterium]|nr:hypothetical protein [Lachnospiraceae bacterium]
MEEPKGFEYWYIDKISEQWCIKEDAPEWAKKEFYEYYDDTPDENDMKRT